jgi:hypothetical protein
VSGTGFRRQIPSDSEEATDLNRLSIAVGIYLLLGVLAWTTLGDNRVRMVTFAILGLFAVKTLVHREDAMHGSDE